MSYLRSVASRNGFDTRTVSQEIVDLAWLPGILHHFASTLGAKGLNVRADAPPIGNSREFVIWCLLGHTIRRKAPSAWRELVASYFRRRVFEAGLEGAEEFSLDPGQLVVVRDPRAIRDAVDIYGEEQFAMAAGVDVRAVRDVLSGERIGEEEAWRMAVTARVLGPDPRHAAAVWRDLREEDKIAPAACVDGGRR